MSAIEIMAVQNAYGVATDTKRWDWLAEIFTADAKIEHRNGPDPSERQRWEDRASWLESFSGGFEANLLASQHMMLSHLAEVDGDRARAFCYGNVVIVPKANPAALVTTTAYYDDSLVRVDGVWRIARRTLQQTLARTAAQVTPIDTMVSATGEAAGGRIGFLNDD
jgi:SnoaL-like domain